MTKSRLLGPSELRDPGAPTGGTSREGGLAVQTGGTVRGVNTMSHSRWPNALRTLAFVALVAGRWCCCVWAVPPARAGRRRASQSGVVSTVVHDDACNVRGERAPPCGERRVPCKLLPCPQRETAR